MNKMYVIENPNVSNKLPNHMFYGNFIKALFDILLHVSARLNDEKYIEQVLTLVHPDISEIYKGRQKVPFIKIAKDNDYATRRLAVYVMNRQNYNTAVSFAISCITDLSLYLGKEYLPKYEFSYLNNNIIVFKKIEKFGVFS